MRKYEAPTTKLLDQKKNRFAYGEHQSSPELNRAITRQVELLKTVGAEEKHLMSEIDAGQKKLSRFLEQLKNTFKISIDKITINFSTIRQLQLSGLSSLDDYLVDRKDPQAKYGTNVYRGKCKLTNKDIVVHDVPSTTDRKDTDDRSTEILR